MSNVIFDKENEDRPYIAVNGVIIKKINNKDHILLGKRKNVAGAGFYYLPGGHIHRDEKIQQTLVREMKEECDLDVTSGKCIWIEENLAALHHVTFYYEALLKNENDIPKNVEPQKCEGWEWHEVDNPPKPLWVTLGDFIKKYSKDTIKGI